MDFRKSLVLAAAALAMGVTASAQTYSCTGTTGAPPLLRSEGATELTGAIVITCNNVPNNVTVNVDLQLNAGAVPITSRINPYDAAIQVNGTGPTSLLTNNYYAGTPISVGSSGTLNDVRFTGVQIPAGTDTITISGIRGNVANGNVSISAGGFGVVAAQVSISNGSLPLQNNNYTVGLVTPSLSISTGAVTGSISTCAGATAITANSGVSGSVNIKELFPTAFKIQVSPQNSNVDSESGPNPVVAAANAPASGGNPAITNGVVTPAGAAVNQTANTATQFAVTFAGVPSGVTLNIPTVLTGTNASGTTSTAVLVTGEGSTTPATAGVTDLNAGKKDANNMPLPPLNTVVATGGTTYFYNVTSVDPNSIDSFNLPVYPATAANNVNSILTSPTVTISYAPRTSFTSSLVPRFVAGSGAGAGTTVNLFNTTGCQTTLLFPFLTNQAGFDTGMSIAATGTGKFGDPQQGGTCTVTLYGVGAPATAPSLVVPAAGEGHTTISAIAPGFQGFGIATCPFNYAHGFVFVTDGFMGPGKGLSEGYLPLVLLRGGAGNIPASSSGQSENLNN